MTIYSEFAPAKVNLTLEVLGKRPDGYHEIASLVAFARDCADHVSLDLSRPAGSEVTGSFGATISGKNLIDVTLSKLTAADPELKLGHVVLTKNLPIAAGIGGGSADAAALLRLVRNANPERRGSVNWKAIAANLGADVPVCFENRASWMTGIGDQVQPVFDLPPLTAVLVNPLVSMPADKTAKVFQALNAGPNNTVSVKALPGSLLNAAELIDFMMSHGNALDAAACSVAPVIADVKRALLAAPGCNYAAVSGAGPTCFGIYDDNTAAAAAIARDHSDWWVRAVTLS
jgi:4-diphosphocytidyl-2-C-methyl-D-erythritol kinase